MAFWRRHRSLRIAIGMVLLAPIASCYTWRPVTGPLPQAIEKTEPTTRIRVTRASTGETAEYVRPSLVHDSLIVWRDPMTRAAISLADVRSVAILRLAAGKTVLAVGGVALLLAIVAVGVVASTGGLYNP